MNDLSRELGITLGVTVLGSLVANLYRTNVREALEGTAPAATIDQVGESIGAVDRLAAELPASLAPLVTSAANQSFVDALSVGYLAAAGFVALALGVAAAFLPKTARSAQASFADETPALPAVETLHATGHGAAVPATASVTEE